MGITGLIPFLEKASEKLHLKDIRGSSVAVDTYCWLHKGVFSCAEKLARGEDTDVYVQYCLKYVQLLLSYDIKPILVFDGQHLPAKALTEKRRRESRQESKKKAADLLRLGRTEEARSQMRRCVDVTHEMALRLIQACRERNVDCIVAPYEADAQMAWLNKAGIVQYIVTEDSDLTLFGAKKVIFKLDLSGSGLLVVADKLHLAMGCREDRYHFDKFRRMCILSGCDYLDSLPGIGLAKACKFILKTEQDDMRIALKKIPQYLNMRNLEVNDDYIENFLKAEATFKHMFIYNPLERRMERLNEVLETDISLCSNAGTLLVDSQKAYNLALGNLNPFTLECLDNWDPLKSQDKKTTAKHIKRAKHNSIWETNYNKSQTESSKPIQSSCQMFFKKKDFVGQTIEAEIKANQRLEESKQTEAEVFKIYSTNAKRRRCSSISTGGQDQERELTPPPSPMQTKSRHNPFAKEMIKQQQPSSPVCQSGSLLRLLSPRKGSPEEEISSRFPDETRVNATKRNIFVREQVEIRSRFFSTKASQLKEQEETEVIVSLKVEEHKEEENALTELRDLPLAIKQSRKSNELQDEDEKELMGFSKKKKLEASDEDDACEKPLDADCKDKQEDIVLLSDDDSSSIVSSQEMATSSKNSLLPNTRRVGLSKPTKSSSKPAKSKTKTAKLSSATASQTKLSMFGFQKRPMLK